MRLNAKTSDSIWNTSLDAVMHTPDTGLERLISIAKKDQWFIQDLEWSRLDFTAFPSSLHPNAAGLFSQLLYGELAALKCAERLVHLLPKATHKDFCALQIKDETRHVQFFSNLLGRLEQP